MLKVQVLKIDKLQGVGKVSGKPYSMDIGTVVITSPSGGVAAGEIVLPEGHQARVGQSYQADLEPRLYKGRIEFQLAGLSQVSAVKAA